MDLNEFLDRVTGAIGKSDVGQVRRALDPNLDRQFRKAEQRNMQRAMEEEQRRQSEICISVFTVFKTRRGLPMELRTINNLNNTSKMNEEVWFCDEASYSGINIWWWCNPEPDEVRNIFSNITSKRKFDITWDNFRGTLINVFAEDLQNLFRKGLKVKFRDDNYDEYKNKEVIMRISDFSKMNHQIRFAGFKDSYTKCYNADNGIKEGCFVTTAVCDSLGKFDDCYELMTFRKFRDTWLTAQPDGKNLINEYYAVAPQIVANINRLTNPAKVYKKIWQNHLEPCLNFLRNNDNISCKNKYIEMMHELKKQFL